MAAAATTEAGYTIKNGKLVDVKYNATLPVQDHYNLGLEELNKKNWKEAARQFFIVTNSFPNSTYAADAYFYLGLAEYNFDEFDFANDAFTAYLKTKNNPKFFQEAIQYKYAIAEKLNAGFKRRFFGTKRMPKWASGKSLALQIYDEVIASLPCHDLAARALYSKGTLLWDQKEYKRAVESYQMIVKRFPKHELAPESYVTISKIFLEQSATEFQNPDVLEFAQINMRRFNHDFPKEPRLSEVEQDVLSIKEIYAKGLYDTGQFYERVGKPRASIIYYENAIKQFPETHIALLSKQRLAKYQKKTH
jgi:outer membrane protein assembly factor BamD (BamD/ComL family)